LESALEINANRSQIWARYRSDLDALEKLNLIEFQKIPSNCSHNSHLFFIKLKDAAERSQLISYLKERGIVASFHYSPLHSTVPGSRYGRFFGADINSTKESNRLLRLPLYFGIDLAQVKFVVDSIYQFFSIKRA
jgi:dTDP-4-amino-4,6-dideoxygalactose transaminase